jgi:isopentenyl phosphate kinase
MFLIKLGGSVITDKTRYRVFERDRVARLCREIKDSGQQAIIVHGAGSFGHVLAKKYELNNGFKDPAQIPAVAQVCYDTRELSSMVVRELLEADIPAVSVAPGSCFEMDDRKLSIGDESVIRDFVKIGIMPVMFGDVVLDRKLGFAICSGDQIMEVLARMFSPERVIFVSDVDGLYSDNPKTNPKAAFYEKVDAEILNGIRSDSSVADVTGGVRGKMESMLRMCSGDRDCVLVNGLVEGRLQALMRGEQVKCTRAVSSQ